MPKLDRLRARRENGDFNLSFLDIMACGLGAVILLFLIIKHNTDGGSVEAEILLDRLETMQRESEQLTQEVENVARLNAAQELLGDEMVTRRASSASVLAALDERRSEQTTTNAKLSAAIKAAEAKNAADLVQDRGVGEEQYLMGLRVDGKRIAILLDHSASMTDEKLIDVIRSKVGTQRERQQTPKWRRARRTLNWLVNRTPATSDIAVFGFSETAVSLGGAGWHKASDAVAINKILTTATALVPQGGTNLSAAYEALRALNPRPTNLYLVTDGLPTKAGKRSPRCAQGNSITSDCRVQLLRTAQTQLSKTLPAVQLDVVLLPLEGDWDAINQYWTAAAKTGGLAISPAPSWP